MTDEAKKKMHDYAGMIMTGRMFPPTKEEEQARDDLLAFLNGEKTAEEIIPISRIAELEEAQRGGPRITDQQYLTLAGEIQEYIQEQKLTDEDLQEFRETGAQDMLYMICRAIRSKQKPPQP